MRAVVLGSGTGIPTARRGPAGFLMMDGPRTILVDSGSGTLGRMARAGVLPENLERVLYTHFHPDHVADLVPILFALRNTPREGDPLAVQGPPGLAALFEKFHGIFGHWIEPGDPPRWRLEEIPPRRHEFPGLAVTPVKTAHTPESQGYRFELGGRVVAVSGDTGPCGALEELGRGADLLVLECSFPDSRPLEQHMTPSACAEVARRAHPRRLLLTHLYPEMDRARGRARKAFAGLACEVVWAKDGMTIDL
ncbi:MAG: MBL fold metallo-hydrolase [Planctomycetes bacterium]|nr:MBL fold metallo-hydrolase [Planctomycetota bacterium]